MEIFTIIVGIATIIGAIFAIIGVYISHGTNSSKIHKSTTQRVRCKKPKPKDILKRRSVKPDVLKASETVVSCKVLTDSIVTIDVKITAEPASNDGYLQ